MPLDGVTVYGLVNELSKDLVGARIEKIQQPEKDKLYFTLSKMRASSKLLLCSASGSARAHLTHQQFENPKEPPMFCMLLRKHLTGGTITAVTQPNFDRLIQFDICARDELFGESSKKLILELIGKTTNIILLDAEGRIIDCTRRRELSAEGRAIQPGLFYEYPEKQARKDLIQASFSDALTFPDLSECLADDYANQLSLYYAGLSPLLSREIACHAYNQADLYCNLVSLTNIIKSAAFQPTICSSPEKPVCFSCIPIQQYGEKYSNTAYSSFSEMLDAFYEKSDAAESKRRKSREILQSLNTTSARLNRKLTEQSKELEATKDREDYRIKAELIKCNMYRIHRGDRYFECENYYLPEAPLVRIELDPKKTPQQNADFLFKKYRKLKTAEVYLKQLTEETFLQKEYIESVMEEVARADTEKELSDIRQELEIAGFIRSQQNKNNGKKDYRKKMTKPLEFTSPSGMSVLVGKNNIQNDELTFRVAERFDYWFHIHLVHGSHVILRCGRLQPEEEDILYCAKLAAFHSQARDSGKATVDYTVIKNVKKIPGNLPGMVNYTGYKSVVVNSDGN